MRTVRQWLLIVGIVASLAGAGCASSQNPNLVTVEQQAADRNTEILVRVNRLQTATIQAAKDKSIPEATADTIVTWTVETAKVLRSNPVDGVQFVQRGWPAIRAEAVKYPQLQLIIPSLDELLRETR